jgi:LmbE family N-acetylglucosaminyl deacetylase
MRPDEASNVLRLADAPIADGGTPAEEWLPWRDSLPPLPLEDCPGLVVVAAHPDDETLGFGGATVMAAARGVDVHTVVASDGGAAWPDLAPWEQKRLEQARRHESRCAAALMGLHRPTFLGLPDGGLADQEARMADSLSDLLDERPAGTWCAATWRGDGHPDHEAVGRAAAVAASRTGAVLLEYPVWMWHWAKPDDPNIPGHRAARVVTDSVAAERKQRAVELFQSQLEPGGTGRDPILPPHVVTRLLHVGEVVFR